MPDRLPPKLAEDLAELLAEILVEDMKKFPNLRNDSAPAAEDTCPSRGRAKDKSQKKTSES